MKQKQHFGAALAIFAYFIFIFNACLPPSTPYPNKAPGQVVEAAKSWSNDFETYIKQWLQGAAAAAIPNTLIPQGISDSKNFYLKNPDQVTPEETWAVRRAKPINKDSLYTGIPDPKVTYLFLGTALAPFGSKLVMEGEFPHCRFFSIQISPPLNGLEYYAQRVYGTAEVSMADVDIEPLPGSVNPFRVGANRNAPNRKYRVEFDLTTGDPVSLNNGAHQYPYRLQSNKRAGAMLTYQGPLGYKSIIGTPLETQGDWNLGALWIRIYEPDNQVNALGGVPLPKVWFELPDGSKYFVGSDFTALQKRADLTIANRITEPNPGPDGGPEVGWFKSWGITRSMLNGVCLANNWSRPDSGARVRAVDLGWTGRGEFQPAPGNIEPHATTNNYATYLGRSMTVAPGYVAVLTGKLPTFPETVHGEAQMTSAQVRYWSICGIDQDPASPLPATTIHAISDDEVTIDSQRNYMIVYSRPADRPTNALKANGVSWVDWGTQSSHGLLMRWVNIAPEWSFPMAPQEHHLDWAHSEWAGSQYDSTLVGVNWRNGFMQCYLPRVHYMTVAEFEALGNSMKAENIPVWVDSSYQIGASEALLGTVTASSVLDGSPDNAAANAIDSDIYTAWSSAFGQENAFITVDLGSPKVISAIKLGWDWIFFAKNYTIEVSNNQSDWNTVATVTDENGQIDLFKNLQNIRARYVRLNLSKANIGYYRLGSFEVYTNDCNCNAATTQVSNQPVSNRVDLLVYPNPAGQVLRYKVQGQTSTKMHISVYNLSGHQVKALENQSDTGEIDLSDLPTGAYIFHVTDGNKPAVTRKFVHVSGT